ncbi:MAG: hypothetical protein IPG90_00880 [Bacteroidetes bacterium]|jgi:uncharacterized protein YebE (UPF0316 family)|nr:hypothetical protein [Bacteroidota bacterium]MBP6401340.1 hypothetical protein [Bacteroidia bacterium]MBK6836990.1 hypothetical protein [Bacteroidota bacterium]MBK9523608.1 hypothetical protein [Bacteroidota bacterium]MBK9541356.1 hypothetical protein [Bacteroidota bacterium]
MNDRRRLIIIIISVGVGSLISLYIVKQRLGNLKREDYIQLGFNFLFAIAVVVGIALLLQNMNKKNPNGPGN